MNVVVARSTCRRLERRLRLVLLLVSVVIVMTGCHVFYAWLYGEAELVVTNNADVPVVEVLVYLVVDESLVHEDITPIPVGESRTIRRLQRLEHRVDGLLEHGQNFSIVADLSDLDRITVEVVAE